MKPTYTNLPINKPSRRRGSAVKTLAVMSVVLAMMFGIKLFYDPELPGGDRRTDAGEAAAAGALPYDTFDTFDTEETTAETTAPQP